MKYRQALLIGLCVTTFITEILAKPASSGVKSGTGKLTSQKGVVSPSKNNAKAVVTPNAEASKVSKSSSGSLFSAWGIISLVLFVIGSSALIYYVSIFYPMVCAKRGKYDVMEMTAV